MWLQTRWRRRKILPGCVPLDRMMDHLRDFHRAAIAAQQSRRTDNGKILTGRDGISKTILWKKCAIIGNFADAETFPLSQAGADRGMGPFSLKKQEEIDRCASRRLLR
jgi:hypothetical protein